MREPDERWQGCPGSLFGYLLTAFAKRRQTREDRVADQIMAFSGSLPFVYIHIVWFTAWIIINVSPWAFDPFLFGLLTLIASLERSPITSAST